MMALVIAAAWCVFNFLLFIAVRDVANTRRERFAFLFQITSFAVFSLITTITAVAGWLSFPVALGMMALHALYSLTVLELWSLSEGSYSLTMLASLAHEPADEAELVAHFRALGEQKKGARLQALQQAGLLTTGEVIALTDLGTKIAKVIRSLRAVANFRDPG